MRRLKENDINEPLSKEGTILKTLAPKGKHIRKTSEGTRYYKLDYRVDCGTHGMPFNPKKT